MTALRIARNTLLASVAIYAATLLLGLLKMGVSDLLFLVSISSVIGIAVSAIACVLLQMRASFLKRPAR